MTLERLKEIKADCEEAKKLWRHVAPSKIFECIAEIERLQQELSLEKANAEMRRKEILLGVKEIVRWRTEAERLIDIMASEI